MAHPHDETADNSSSACCPIVCNHDRKDFFLCIVSADCGKHDPILNEEMNKGLLTMLSEELNLQKIVANETLEHTKQLIMDARKTFSHYQKEAEKCNIGVETCEEARERAEAELIEEHKLTTLWENRASEYGWVE